MRFLFAFAAAFVSAVVVAFAILPFGLVSSLAAPVALVSGALASGLAAWLVGGGGRESLAPVLAASLASLVVAVPVGAALIFVAGANLLIAAPIFFAVVGAASALALRRPRGSGGPAEGRAGRSRIVSALGVVLALVVVLLLPAAEFGYTWLTSCTGEERDVFEEFPQYSPRAPQELDPKPDDPDALSALGSACVVTYRTPDAATVIDYFEGRLEENGWEVRPSSSAALYARKGNYEYRVSFSGDPTGTQEGTPVTVIVREP